MLERLTWDEMMKKYPNRWLVLGNVKYEEGSTVDVAEAGVIDVLDDNDALFKIAEYRATGKPYLYERMYTHSNYVGVVECCN